MKPVSSSSLFGLIGSSLYSGFRSGFYLFLTCVPSNYTTTPIPLDEHFLPIDGDGPGKDIGVQLGVFYMPIVLGKSFARESFCLAFATLIPANPPALHILPSIDPNLSHNIQSIVPTGV